MLSANNMSTLTLLSIFVAVTGIWIHPLPTVVARPIKAPLYVGRFFSDVETVCQVNMYGLYKFIGFPTYLIDDSTYLNITEVGPNFYHISEKNTPSNVTILNLYFIPGIQNVTILNGQNTTYLIYLTDNDRQLHIDYVMLESDIHLNITWVFTEDTMKSTLTAVTPGRNVVGKRDFTRMKPLKQ